ncbi:MAG: helix-turn-helix domain-containing protein [Prevotella sp.]|jgi:excisionase family DNA binding protein|nr:helix-turn-helix domain-containing protein [Prevotella sp.]
MKEVTFDTMPHTIAVMDEKLDLINAKLDALTLPAKEEAHQKLSTVEAAKYIGKSTSTLYDLTSRQEIPFRKCGNKLYFFRDELQKWIENSGRTESSSPGMSDIDIYEKRLLELKEAKRHKYKNGFSTE